VEFLRSITDRRIKITVPGPFTMTQQAQNDYYSDSAELALAYAAAINEEARDLKRAGADIIQIDEPYLQARPEAAREYAIPAINLALARGDMSFDCVQGLTERFLLRPHHDVLRQDKRFLEGRLGQRGAAYGG